MADQQREQSRAEQRGGRDHPDLERREAQRDEVHRKQQAHVAVGEGAHPTHGQKPSNVRRHHACIDDTSARVLSGNAAGARRGTVLEEALDESALRGSCAPPIANLHQRLRRRKQTPAAIDPRFQRRATVPGTGRGTTRSTVRGGTSGRSQRQARASRPPPTPATRWPTR